MKQFGWQVVGCSMPAMQRQEKAWSPRVDHCTDGTTSVMVVEQRRWRRPSTSAVRQTLSAMVVVEVRHKLPGNEVFQQLGDDAQIGYRSVGREAGFV